MCLSVQAGPQIANVLLKNMPGPDNGSIADPSSYFMFNPLHMFVDVVDLVDYATNHPFNFPTLKKSAYVKLNSRAAQDAAKENAKHNNSFFDTEPALERKQSYTRAPQRGPSAVLQIDEKEEAGELKKSERNVFTEEQKNVGADPTRNIGEIGSTFKKEENAPAPWASLVKLKSSTSKVGAGLKRWTASAKKVDEEAPLGFN